MSEAYCVASPTTIEVATTEAADGFGMWTGCGVGCTWQVTEREIKADPSVCGLSTWVGDSSTSHSLEWPHAFSELGLNVPLSSLSPARQPLSRTRAERATVEPSFDDRVLVSPWSAVLCLGSAGRYRSPLSPRRGARGVSLAVTADGK